MCLFRAPAGEAAELIASRTTGLRVSRIGGDMEVVTEDDVREAPSDKKEWLRARVGRRVCAVVEEAVAQKISTAAQAAGFEPSVPFVACLSASMVVTEFVRSVLGLPSPLEPRFQFDVLRGPMFGQLLPQARRTDCVCTTRAKNIDTVRQTRRRKYFA
jgi:hypothetical protein